MLEGMQCALESVPNKTISGPKLADFILCLFRDELTWQNNIFTVMPSHITVYLLLC